MTNLPPEIIALQDEDEYVNLLVYADSGVGKTVFGCSDDDVLVIAPEDNGTLSAKRFGSTALKWKIREGADGWDDIVKAYEWLYEQDPIPFHWVFLDSLTEMQDMAMQKVLRDALAMNPARDPDLPLISDWVPYYNKFRRLVKAFNALEVNCIYSALQQDEEDEEGNKVVLPMLQGKGTQIAKQCASFMSSFGQMRVARKKTGTDENGQPVFEEARIIQWKNSKTVMAKDRTRCLEPRTVNLSLKEVRELLEAGPKPAPQPGRVVPAKTRNKVVRDKPEQTDGDGDVVQLVSVSTDEEE